MSRTFYSTHMAAYAFAAQDGCPAQGKLCCLAVSVATVTLQTIATVHDDADRYTHKGCCYTTAAGIDLSAKHPPINSVTAC